MYVVNTTTRETLISPAEVLANTSIEGVSYSKVLHAISIAEDRFVTEALGDDLYEALCDEKNVTVTSGNLATYQAFINAALADTQGYTVKVGDVINASEHLSPANLLLWNRRLCKYIAECVMAVALPENYTQFTETGVIKSNPVAAVVGDETTKSVGVGLGDMKFMMDKAIERIAALGQSLHKFICKNKADYPLYTKCSRATEERKSNWINLSIYDDNDDYPGQKKSDCETGNTIINDANWDETDW